MYALAPARIYTGDEILGAPAIITAPTTGHHLCPTPHLPRDIPNYTTGPLNIAPGFIDLQLNSLPTCGVVSRQRASWPQTR